MWQNIVIGLCVAVCLAYVSRRVYRAARGRGCSGRCAGCARVCPARRTPPPDDRTAGTFETPPVPRETDGGHKDGSS